MRPIIDARRSGACRNHPSAPALAGATRGAGPPRQRAGTPTGTLAWALAMLVAGLGPGCTSEQGDPSADGGSDPDAALDAGARPDAGQQADARVSPDAAPLRDAAALPDASSVAYQICLDKINQLRATKGRAPYARWTSAESCVDGQATADEQSHTPHGAFGQCGEAGQNECTSGGAAGITACLDAMWAEKDLPGCSGCDACADAYNPSCPNCDFYGTQTGDVCGHYVNLSANFLSQAACGFSALGGWAAIDFR